VIVGIVDEVSVEEAEFDVARIRTLPRRRKAGTA
jgi:hypothetical protein